VNNINEKSIIYKFFDKINIRINLSQSEIHEIDKLTYLIQVTSLMMGYTYQYFSHNKEHTLIFTKNKKHYYYRIFKNNDDNVVRIKVDDSYWTKKDIYNGLNFIDSLKKFYQQLINA